MVSESNYLKAKGRYKPSDEQIIGLSRIDKIDFSGKIHLSDKPSKTDILY